MQSRIFGKHPSGEIVEAYTLQGGCGASLEVITFGGIVRSLCVPDREGRLADVVLGFDNLDSYLAGHPYFGAITGRVAGRIPGARFTVEGVAYELVKNDGQNHLHGGLRGLDKRIWKAGQVERADGADSLRLSYHSPDGEEGYDPVSGRALAVSSTEFCLQVYTSANIDCATPGKSGRPYHLFSGLCLECHGYPGGVDHPEFGSILVVPGCPQRRVTRYAFSTKGPSQP